jgi:hypothetical protein
VQARVEFESPPVSHDGAGWIRDERRSRALLLDYGLHFLDVATMFSTEDWKPAWVNHRLNDLNQTGTIEGVLESSTYSVSFLLRQGYGRRAARIRFQFQNYEVSLGFFPDTFDVEMVGDNPAVYASHALHSATAVARKIAGKLSGREDDDSHVEVFRSLLSGDASRTNALRLSTLAPFYRAVMAVADKVYEAPKSARAAVG